jgi:hypothetical protein
MQDAWFIVHHILAEQYHSFLIAMLQASKDPFLGDLDARLMQLGFEQPQAFY